MSGDSKWFGFYVHKTLEKYSSTRRWLHIEEIIIRIEKMYNQSLSRNTILRCLNEMQYLNMPLHRNKRHGVYLKEFFSDIETEIINAPMIAAQFLTEQDIKKLIKKFGSQLPESQEKAGTDRCNRLVNAYAHSEQKDFFTNLITVYHAIQEKKQIRFYYTDKKPDGSYRAREHHNEKEKSQVTCYSMIYYNGFYYLVGKNTEHNNLSNYRIDKIGNIILTETKAEPLRNCRGYEQRNFKAGEYILDNYKMFNRPPMTVKIKVTGRTANNFFYHTNIVWDEFGRRITDFRETGPLEAVATVRVCAEGAVLFAKQFGDFVELLNPELREEMRKHHKEQWGKYER